MLSALCICRRQTHVLWWRKDELAQCGILQYLEMTESDEAAEIFWGRFKNCKNVWMKQRKSQDDFTSVNSDVTEQTHVTAGGGGGGGLNDLCVSVSLLNKIGKLNWFFKRFLWSKANSWPALLVPALHFFWSSLVNESGTITFCG